MAKAQKNQQELHQVLCDMCLDEQAPALKTCLKCEISMCAQHLQAHLTTPVLLQTHPLTKPTAPGGLNSGSVRCPEHGKLLEYYCLDDRTCVCVSCSIEDQHRLHNMKTFPSAHKVLVEKLRKELEELAERKKQGKALKSWEMEQKKALDISGKDLMKEVSVMCDTGLTKVQNSVAARLGDIQTAEQNIEEALSEEDAHLFLQRYADVHEAVERTRVVDFIHGLEKNAEPEKVVSDLIKYGYDAMKKVKKLQRDLLVLVDPNNQYWGVTKPTSMTFDPATLGGHFLVSSDLKMLSCHSPVQQHVPQRVFLQNSINEDQCWSFQLSDKYNWCVGICDKGFHPNNGNFQLYGLEWKDKQLLGLRSEYVQVVRTYENVRTNYSEHNSSKYYLRQNLIEFPSKSSSTPQDMACLNKVQVHWELSSQTLSFFTRGECDEMICLYRVKVDSYYSLQPFVNLEKRQDQPANPAHTANRHPYGNTQSQSNKCSLPVDFVCSLDDENILSVYSRGQI